VWRLVADALATSEVQPEAGAEASADAVEAGADDKARKPEAESA